MCCLLRNNEKINKINILSKSKYHEQLLKTPR